MDAKGDKAENAPVDFQICKSGNANFALCMQPDVRLRVEMLKYSVLQ